MGFTLDTRKKWDYSNDARNMLSEFQKGGAMSNTVQIKLSACRVNAEKTQKEWADLLNVTTTTINNWESGKTKPNAVQLMEISRLSNIPMDFIFIPKESQ